MVYFVAFLHITLSCPPHAQCLINTVVVSTLRMGSCGFDLWPGHIKDFKKKKLKNSLMLGNNGTVLSSRTLAVIYSIRNEA